MNRRFCDTCCRVTPFDQIAERLIRCAYCGHGRVGKVDPLPQRSDRPSSRPSGAGTSWLELSQPKEDD